MYPLRIKEKYDPNNLAKLGHRFTVPYCGNYISGDIREYVGSHPGVDIVPATKNQETLAILDGTVFKVGEEGAYGKYVFLEHKNVPNPEDLKSTTTLFSCYEHLSDTRVSLGETVKEGDIIGKTGNTGNSFGEHLHFQIDKKEAPFHAYWPFSGAEAKAAGLSFSSGVNAGLGLDKARMYTINPLLYLDSVDEFRKNGNITNNTANLEVKEEIKTNSVVEVKKEEVLNTNNIVSIPEVPVHNTTNNIGTVEKLEIIIGDDNIIVSDPSLDMLASLGDDKKKTLKI